MQCEHNLGERYVYKFVCDPEALFQMALAENHRNALKAEAASVLAKGDNSKKHGGSNEVEAAQGVGGDGKRRHQYSDMLNQVYSSHLTAQLQQGQEKVDYC